MSVNSNLLRHMEAVVAALTGAEERGHHVHASLSYGPFGQSYNGPVTEWDYVKEDEEDFGFLELINYKNETVRKPLVNVGIHDIRPCWDRPCLSGRKPQRPGGAAPLQEQPDAGHDPYAGTGYDGE